MLCWGCANASYSLGRSISDRSLDNKYGSLLSLYREWVELKCSTIGSLT